MQPCTSPTLSHAFRAPSFTLRLMWPGHHPFTAIVDGLPTVFPQPTTEDSALIDSVLRGKNPSGVR